MMAGVEQREGRGWGAARDQPGVRGAAGTRRTLVAAAVVLAASLAGLVTIGAATPYAVLLGPLVMAGLALGVLVPAITAALLGSVEPSRSGIASGTLNTARQTGSVLGVSLFGSLDDDVRELEQVSVHAE
jgi:MFS family permease